MATPKIWWLLSILLATSSNCCAATGPPAPPSDLQCYRQCDETQCSVNIQCTWDPKPDPKIPTNYILHWEPANSEDGHTTRGNSSSGVIPREHSNHGDLRVWVQAQNQHGSANSEPLDFNTEDIMKPQPPTLSSSHQDSLEIHWNTTRCQPHLSIGLCDVRYRTEGDQVWFGYETGFHHSYAFLDAQPNTVYEFQVRCTCNPGLKSDWSEILRIINAESVPVGEVDVWSDCGMPPTSLDCFLTWKNLSISPARRPILRYKVRISFNNGTVLLKNVSTAEPSSQFMCDDNKWCLDFPLKDASSVAVSAYNALGATVPSSLAVPKTAGKEPNDQRIHLNMNQENLTVSWGPPFPDNLKEYVVQYKQAGCSPGRGFDWIKVNKSQMAAFFKGHFKDFTAYQVSLFSVSNNLEVRLLASKTGYSTESTPSAVPGFKVTSIGTTDVTLSWEPVPISEQNGLILFYQIGLDGQEVRESPRHGKMTRKLQDLRPGQNYEVWIKAVTVAGPGESVSMRFKTKKSENGQITAVTLGVVLPVLFLISLVVCLLCVCQRENKVCPLMSRCLYDKVPDPGNSHIFSHLKPQFNESMGWICIPIEPQPKISLLEVVEKTPQVSDGLTKLVVRDGGSQMNDDEKEDAATDESDRTDLRYGKEAYSKMVDSDEEKEDCWSSSEEEDVPSGYERHFMPTAVEILEC